MSPSSIVAYGPAIDVVRSITVTLLSSVAAGAAAGAVAGAAAGAAGTTGAVGAAVWATEAKARVLKDPRVASRARTMQGFDGNIGKYVSLAYLEAEKVAF